MARRTKEDAQKTRQVILDTALELFGEHGITKTSLTDIATAAGVTRGAIYWHFKNKNELFINLWDEFCEPLSNLLDASINADEPNPINKLRSLFTTLFEDMATNQAQRQLFFILFSLDNASQDITEICRHTQLKYEEFLTDLENSVKNAVAQGQLAKSLDAKITANLIATTVNGCNLRIIQAQSAADAQKKVQTCKDIIHSLFNMLSQPSAIL
ncbi:TetR family transcriptional regulator [Celerinatantimonas diazotrophica]|uniref:TetR family transcriptional regulator n=2 Tax=Celerinatantimonas diazotrophica TaxID=412034 RepID=A0A4R1J9N8_9GAMM|nr:TetR family transcriptional regulator [Celerinatantimonas diazotrophica]CAG9295062.1 HTH-type transcriptional regulator TtgR [Celerinatantimonas diazotrophica]